MFCLPKHATSYTKAVITRCHDLISEGIWSGIDKIRFQGWLNNFKSEEEKYFSARLLDGLIYRSKDQTIAMLEQLLHRTLPDLQAEHPMPFGEISDWVEFLKNRSTDNSPLRLVAVKGEYDSPGKSSSILMRHLMKEFGTHEGIMIEADQIENCIMSGIKTFVFIDDFMGTGKQFIELCNEIDIKSFLPDAYFAYTPLVSHVQGIQALTKYAPNIKVSSVEVLEQCHDIFSPQSLCFSDGGNSADDALAFYRDLVKDRNLSLRGDEKGYGNLGILYAFEHGAPDNCVSILWHSEQYKWSQLFLR